MHMHEWSGEDKSPQTRLILGFSIFIPPIRCARGVFHNFYGRRSHRVRNMTITGGAAEQLSSLAAVIKIFDTFYCLDPELYLCIHIQTAWILG